MKRPKGKGGGTGRSRPAGAGRAGGDLLAARYPNVADHVFGGGWIEIGPESYAGSFARALDEGGMVWEGKREYASLEDALEAMDKGIAEWRREIGL